MCEDSFGFRLCHSDCFYGSIVTSGKETVFNKKENEKKEYKEAILCAVSGIIIFVGIGVFIVFYLMH